MYTSRTIANYFIKSHPEGDLTPMKLLTLVYFSYGWYLALTGKPLVSEKPEAWKLGPVFPDLYDQLKKYGIKSVKEPLVEHSSVMLHEDDVKFLEFMWKKYGEYDGIKLSAITYTEGTPWAVVYPRGYNLVIPDDLIRDYYASMLLKQPDIPPLNQPAA
jgi:uncharacterized phage-associated protein